MTEQNRNQYFADEEGLAGEPDSSWEDYDDHDGGSPMGLHDTTLFDQDESSAGEPYDEATGERIDNSTTDNTGPIEYVIEDDIEADDYDNDLEWLYLAALRLEEARRAAIEKEVEKKDEIEEVDT